MQKAAALGDEQASVAGLRLHVDVPAANPDRRVGFAADAIRLVLVFILFALVTAIFFRPWLSHMQSALIGPPEDNLQDFWNGWYAAVGHEPGSFFFTRKILFPEGTPLHYHSFSYTQIFMLVVLAKIFGAKFTTLILLQNLTLLLTFPLAGLGAFCLTRHFTGNDWASVAGGFVFAFNPSHVQHVMHHAHVASIEFLPFFVLAYLLAMERKSLAWLGIAAVFWALNALSCWYYLFYAGYFVVFHTIYLRLRDDKLPTGWRLFAPIATAAATALLLSPFLVPMVRESASASTYLAGANTFVADLFAFFAFPPTHLLSAATADLYRRFTANPWEGTVYLGLVNLAVIAVLVARSRRHKDPVLTYLLWGMLTFCILAMGECVHAGGHVYSYLHLPGILLSKLPFVANVRTPSRAIVMAYLFLSIGIGRAVAIAWPSRHSAAAGLGILIVVALGVLDFYPARLAMTPLSCQAGLNILRDDPAQGFGILNLPNGYVENNYYMAQQGCHGRPIAGGVVARQIYPTLIDRLETRDMNVQRHQLTSAGIKYVVIHHPRDGMFVWHKTDGIESLYKKTYPVAYDANGITILRVY